MSPAAGLAGVTRNSSLSSPLHPRNLILVHMSERIIAQQVRWLPSQDGKTRLGLFSADDASGSFLSKKAAEKELATTLLPQLFADPRGWEFAVHDFNGKKDWIIWVVDKKGERYCDLWLGNNPDAGWAWDGLIRVGDADAEPHVWQAYERYSDGEYRRVFSLCRSIDQFRNAGRR